MPISARLWHGWQMGYSAIVKILTLTRTTAPWRLPACLHAVWNQACGRSYALLNRPSSGRRAQPVRPTDRCEFLRGARDFESEVVGLLAINVVPGFAFSNVHDAGLSFSAIVEGDTSVAYNALLELVDLAWSLRREGLRDGEDLDGVLERILPVKRGPVLLVEPADNIGGGAPGDCTDVLRALVRHKAVNAGGIMADVDAVAALQGVAVGDRRTLAIGGRGSRLDLGPLQLDVELISRSDGRFELEDRHSHAAGAFGVKVNMGPCAVVRHEGVTILLTSIKTPPWDLGQWRSQGIDPRRLRIIGIKAAVAHRRAYDPIAVASHTISSRGPCTSNLSALPYSRLRRPIFPLDAGEMNGGNRGKDLRQPDECGLGRIHRGKLTALGQQRATGHNQ